MCVSSNTLGSRHCDQLFLTFAEHYHQFPGSSLLPKQLQTVYYRQHCLPAHLPLDSLISLLIGNGMSRWVTTFQTLSTSELTHRTMCSSHQRFAHSTSMTVLLIVNCSSFSNFLMIQLVMSNGNESWILTWR